MIPKVADRNGYIFLNQILRPGLIEIDIKYQLNPAVKTQNGFAIWYLRRQPRLSETYTVDGKEVPKDFGRLFGFKPDYNGIGVLVFKKVNTGNWMAYARENDGMKGITISEDSLTQNNSCKIENGLGLKTIRITKTTSSLSVQMSHPTAKGQFVPCAEINNLDLNYQGYLGLSSLNAQKDFISDIDIFAIEIKSDDAAMYNNLDAETLQEIDYFAKSEDLSIGGPPRQSRDLVHDGKRAQEKEQQKEEASLRRIHDEDSEMQVLQKFYETQKMYNQNLKELSERLRLYREDYNYYAENLMSKDQYRSILAQVEDQKRTVVGLKSQLK